MPYRLEMNRHQVLTGAANSGDHCFAVGTVEGVPFTHDQLIANQQRARGRISTNEKSRELMTMISDKKLKRRCARSSPVENHHSTNTAPSITNPIKSTQYTIHQDSPGFNRIVTESQQQSDKVNTNPTDSSIDRVVYSSRGSVVNMLVTSCRDNICRLWVQTLVPNDGLINAQQIEVLANTPRLQFQKNHKRIMTRLNHIK
ncbi:DMXL1 [Cordylochernes scorpioides]|uniref:DMXL1 n=1 Tax=Cordylochernes scorpioides TaxID=51811 RepID=A0ABY6KTW7_9ARAC|nr:DMXL1 [Cordylochernes scorpioides]